ncbi:hypothetical protein [Sphingobium sp.]|uniref:hypothetical protein n=1 Tax=Sphingobium sp. TaxID=1912891 RepID=UPI000DB591B4|nr:hypothetical protein [Sphingobium sp.]PZU66741.1 MAG: hypothetical protein DI540_13680 [Sphingobium sp.]
MAHYSETSLETAACLWEAVLTLRARPITDPDAIGLALAIDNTFDALGTAALRLTVVGWTDVVEAAWRAAENNYPLCFDWDFVPNWIIDNIDWSAPHHPCMQAKAVPWAASSNPSDPA